MKNSMVESLLSLLGHLGILTNICDAVNSNKNSRRSSNQQEQKQDRLSKANIQKNLPFKGWRSSMHWKSKKSRRMFGFICKATERVVLPRIKHIIWVQILLLWFWVIDEPTINFNARDVGNLDPCSSLIFLAAFFQQRTVCNLKLLE